jgi:hypothetical protein
MTNKFNVNIAMEWTDTGPINSTLLLKKNNNLVELTQKETIQINDSLASYFTDILVNKGAMYYATIDLKFLCADTTLEDIETIAEEFKNSIKEQMIKHYNKYIKVENNDI